MGTDGDSNDDYRGVIDDLTIENQRLKSRLKKLERLHDSHLKDDKLFEVRVHGLSVARKRELEEMLQNFALSLSNIPQIASGSSRKPALTTQGTSSSYVSHFNDSAYASASASGQGSSSIQSALGGARKNPFKQSNTSRQQNIQTYLTDIPETLLPQQTITMTEKAKKQLVVQRLEQIFAGKGAAKDGHQHPLQQQEVSKLAANADRSADEALGRFTTGEGKREAHIMPQQSEEPVDTRSTPHPDGDSTQHIAAAHKITERDFAKGSSEQHLLEQRPTRPLDLDTYRAQIPADNFDYIRHLGFSPPDSQTMEAFTEGHGWIYLNLLVNMAQLHTINVTPDFVQKALVEYSNKFDVSHDGRKVRWKGGRTLTRTSSEGNDSSSERAGSSADGLRPRKRMKTTHDRTNALHSHHQQRPHSGQDRKLSYTPLFFHRTGEDTSEESFSVQGESMTTTLHSSGLEGESSGLDSTGIRPRLNNRNRSGEGAPIIFYNNVRFCTDLSGDHRTSENMTNSVVYTIPTSQPLGIRPKIDPASLLEKRGPLYEAIDLPEAMDLRDNPIPEAMEVSFPSQTPMTSGPERSPLDFEACGLGGVCPADNFSINVRTQYARVADAESADVQTKGPGRKYSSRISNILSGKAKSSKARPQLHRVLSTRKRDLPPSMLPPAACFMDVDESEDESDAESCSFIEGDVSDLPPPITAPQLISLPSWSDQSEAGDGEDYDDDSESDGSVDMLATARQADPEAIRAREREYDAATAERLAEEIPAGSSAATAEGGSGFGSPVSGLDPAEFADAVRARNKKQKMGGKPAPQLKRSPTTESMVVNQDHS